MSYDMYIGEESFNYTYNVSKMWYAAAQSFDSDKGIRCFYGLIGKQAAVLQLAMYKWMVENKETCMQWQPENGWGSYDGALNFLNCLITASLNNPLEVWTGD